MYIDPFLAGVLATILAELSILLALSIITHIKGGKRHD